MLSVQRQDWLRMDMHGLNMQRVELQAVLSREHGMQSGTYLSVSRVFDQTSILMPQFSFTVGRGARCSCGLRVAHSTIGQRTVLDIPLGLQTQHIADFQGNLEYQLNKVFQPYSMPDLRPCCGCGNAKELQWVVIDRLPLRLVVGGAFARVNEDCSDIFQPITLRALHKTGRSMSATYKIKAFSKGDGSHYNAYFCQSGTSWIHYDGIKTKMFQKLSAAAVPKTEGFALAIFSRL